MRIAGLQKLSLVDYPGCLSAAVFVQGCNFRCGYCQNPDLVIPSTEHGCSEEEILEYISAHKNMLEGVVITGGEPCIYEDLPDFARRVKKRGFKVKLDTNGSNPDQVEHMFREKLIDYIAVDLKTSLDKYRLLADMENIKDAVEQSIRLIILSTVPYEFRTTCVPGIVEEEDIRSFRGLMKGAKKFCLQQYQPFKTYDKSFQDIKPYSKEQLQRFGDILNGFVEKVEIRGI